MGMYTLINVDCTLKQSDEVLGVLRYLESPSEQPINRKDWPSHSLFDAPRWWLLFNDGSHYFHECSYFSLERKGDEIGSPHPWHLAACGNLKDYDQEIQLFFDWIRPYVVQRYATPIGFYRYEEDEENTYVFVNGKTGKIGAPPEREG